MDVCDKIRQQLQMRRRGALSFRGCVSRNGVDNMALDHPTPIGKALGLTDLSGHYSRDWSEYVNVIGAIREPFAREFR